MSPQEYLSQAYRLEQRIRLDMEELEELRVLSASVSSPGFEQHYNPNQPTDAPFVKTLRHLWNMEQKVSDELNELIRLKEEIQTTICSTGDVDERLVLIYRYLRNMSWTEIGEELNVNERTIRRWHHHALEHLTVPEEKM
jgi:RNA polymerase sigma factor (sigma-70 family)